ncbi:hypothetical protein [Streptomyces sp. CAU 1734]|uniref:hypothetical protein n=1 Tax=Streptomyces sp. CAU 1734 TaxID=3140360 RepID=UPI003260F57F
MDEEIAEWQADITRQLLHHIHAPLTGAQYIRGILPVPPPAEAITFITGTKTARTPHRVLGYEIPLRTDSGRPRTSGDMTGILRTLYTGTHIFSSSLVSTVMGMTVIRVDPSTLTLNAPSADDNALRILRAIVEPWTEEQPDPRLRGFLFLAQDRLRLYLDTEGAPGVIGADVRPSGAITALVAALPSLIAEKERITVDSSDPHCSHLVDLTDW